MLAIISIILIPVIFLNTYWRSKKFSPMLEEDYNKRNRLQRLAYSTFIYWKQIKSLNLEDYECIKYNVHLREYGMFREKLNMYNYFNSLLEGFQKTFLVNNSIYFVGCFFIINNYMTMGALLMFVQYFNSFYSSIFSMQNIIVSYQKNLPSLKRFAYLLFDIKKDENRTVVINEAVQSVELKDIIFQYPNSDFRLDVPDLKIFVGDRVAIIGETGSGKTSFLQILLGTQIPNQGKVLINNIDITGTRVLDFNRVFSIVSQENVFFNMSIRDNFLLVNNMATDEMIERCCKAAYIWDKISSLPDGLNTTLGENAECLSHGERQRLAFARAFLNDADIFVLDEVTASLDPFSEGEINKCISQMPKDKTVVMITHKIDKIPDTFKIYTMLDGKISLAET